MNIEMIQKLFHSGNIRWSQHCVERMGERDISFDDIAQCIEYGEIIEDYPDDFPHPSCLILGCLDKGKMIHTVVGSDTQWLYIITAYYPSPDKFREDGKTRR